ncbi:MAG: ATP-binding cassette domain-containing protein [Hyphomicrobiales bacterium]|nr:ATP-binding cassette domain-containing protein [Hyphomicrobiales bacterium]
MSVRDLGKRFGRTTVVDRLTFDIARSEFVCVLGPSGCGKTTLLRLIAGFETADSGSIAIAGTDVTRLAPEQRDFGIVFQSYALFPNRTVAGNVGFGLEATKVSSAQRHARVAELLALVGLTEHTAKYPSQLSGGQQQRVALARALALSPGLLLLDEPLSALDANVRSRLRLELLSLQRRVGVTALMVTHDQQEALAVADRIIVMNQGRIVQIGTPQQVFETPADLFVARFMGEMNAFTVSSVDDGRLWAGPLCMLRGRPAAAVPERAHLCIRPSAVLVGAEAAATGRSMAAQVRHMLYLGDTVRLSLAVPGDAGDVVHAELPSVRMSSLPRLGDEIAIAFPPEHVQLLADGG